MVARYDAEIARWVLGKWVGSQFVVIATYPNF